MHRVVHGWQLTRTWRHTIDPHEGTWTHEDTFVALGPDGHEQRSTQTHRLSMVPFAEVRDDLRAAGFVDLSTYRSLRHRKPAPVDGPRHVVVARRP